VLVSSLGLDSVQKGGSRFGSIGVDNGIVIDDASDKVLIKH